MHKIGETLAGTVIVEMSADEWASLGGMEIELDSKSVVLSEKLAHSFSVFIESLDAPQKVKWCLLRSLGYNMNDWSESGFNRAAFCVQRRYVLPEEWAKVVVNSRWKDYDLMSIRNFGKNSLKELKASLTRKLE